LLDESSRVLVSRGNHFRHPREAAIPHAELAPRAHGVGQHRIAIEVRRETGKRAGPLSPNGYQPGFPELLEMLGHIGLGLPRELGQLSDRKLVLGGQPEQA